MQKFIFKLDAVLKIKEFNVKKIEIQLGKILIKIKGYEQKVISLQHEIKQAYIEQEILMRNVSRADFISFFANLVKVKHIEIRNISEKLQVEKQFYENCVADFAKARGELKMFEKMKGKKLELHKKQMLAKSNLEIEEINNIHNQVTLKNGVHNGN